MILPQDSVYSENVSEINSEQTESGPGIEKRYAVDSTRQRQLISLTAYARTDGKGSFEFTELPNGKAFEVLPLQPGYQFGASKGIQELDEDISLDFFQSPHTI